MTHARALLIVRFIGLVAVLATVYAGVTGLMKIAYHVRHNPPSLMFWSVYDSMMHHSVGLCLWFLASVYVLVDGRFIAFLLLRGLPKREAHRCPGCGYDLSGEEKPGCSECGWGRREGAGEG